MMKITIPKQIPEGTVMKSIKKHCQYYCQLYVPKSLYNYARGKLLEQKSD